MRGTESNDAMGLEKGSPPSVMVGLGPTIHEFRWATLDCGGKLVDGRAKHDHDDRERVGEP
jgi:hypothetical protein